MFGFKEQIEKVASSDTVESPSNPSFSEFSDDDFILSSRPAPSFPGSLQFPIPGAGMEGEGDGLSTRPLQPSEISPIRRSFGTHEFNCTPPETPPSSPTTPAGFDALLAVFEKDGKTDDSSAKHYTLPQQLLLTEKIAEMKEPDARNLLAKVLVDNLGLRQELSKKERHLNVYKGQMLAILDMKVEESDGIFTEKKSEFQRPSSAPASQTLERKSRISFGLSQSKIIDSEDDSFSSTDSDEMPSKNKQEIRMVEEVYGIRRSLSFIQEYASSIDVDQDLLRDRIKGGCYLTNQVLIGGLSGWVTAIFFKKFGKIALSAGCGGLLLLFYSARKGYVNVNYDSIYQEISRLCDDDHENMADDEGEGCSEDANSTSILSASGTIISKSKSKSSQSSADSSSSSWGLEKVKVAKRWITSHTYAVGGYALTFIYHMI